MSLSQITQFISEMPLHIPICICIAYLIGWWRAKAMSTWSGRLSIIFSDGYELMSAYGKKDETFRMNLDACITKIVLKNATRRILPPLKFFNERGQELPFFPEYFADGRIELIFANKIFATPISPTTLYIKFVDPSGEYRYVQVDLTVPEKK